MEIGEERRKGEMEGRMDSGGKKEGRDGGKG